MPVPIESAKACHCQTKTILHTWLPVVKVPRRPIIPLTSRSDATGTQPGKSIVGTLTIWLDQIEHKIILLLAVYTGQITLQCSTLIPERKPNEYLVLLLLLLFFLVSPANIDVVVMIFVVLHQKIAMVIKSLPTSITGD